MANKDSKKIPYLPRIIAGSILIILFVVILVLSIVFPDSIFANCMSLVGRTSYLGVDFMNILERLLGTVFYFALFIGLEILIRLIIDIATNKANNKVKTISRLIGSTIKYGCSLVFLFLALTLWGVDTTALLVSAGIIALVIGLGAQSLISDIIAGINIVFEGEYHVGDVVFIDGFRGTIEEIGLTLTKIVDAGGNRKCINNSKISTVVNLSSDDSLAIVVFSIEYSEDLRKVEKIFADNKENIRKEVPELLETPRYLGVDALSASSVDLKFVAKVNEGDRFSAQRALTRALYLMFADNGIYVPYNQLVLSTRKDGSYQSDVLTKKAAPVQKKEEVIDATLVQEESVAEAQEQEELSSEEEVKTVEENQTPAESSEVNE